LNQQKIGGDWTICGIEKNNPESSRSSRKSRNSQSSMIFVSLKKLRPLLVSLLIWLALDLFTKEMATYRLVEKVELVKGWFSLSLHHNRGVAFGIWFGQWPQVLLALFILVCLGWMAVELAHGSDRNRFLKLSLLGIIMGGAIGNLMNRIVLGTVIDFIDLWPIPVFNLGDVGITIGLVALLILSLKKPIND
jgi:signal peptidase II